MKVLVSAATMHGSTAGIADAIGDALVKRGFQVDVIPPRAVFDVGGYDAVVLGSAVYAGHWLESAREFAAKFGPAMRGRPVWLFSSGPVGDPSRKLVQKMSADPLDIPEITRRLGAREHRVFAGRLDAKHVNLAQRVALLFFRGLEGDFRDWDQIRTWAASVADQLDARAPSARLGSAAPAGT